MTHTTPRPATARDRALLAEVARRAGIGEDQIADVVFEPASGGKIVGTVTLAPIRVELTFDDVANIGFGTEEQT